MIMKTFMKSVYVAALFFSQNCFSQNPFITSIYTADPSAHVWADGRLYVYPSHDIDPAKGCDLMDRYHVFSTADMVNWRDEGEILNAGQVSWGRKEGGFMWAPDCAYKNGTYYFYFPHPSGTEWNKTWKIGIATSKKPASDFKAAGYIEGLSGKAMIDPCVFVDTDGQAYFYYGGGSVCEGGKLKDNMTEIDGQMQAMTGLADFHEAAWVFKRNGIYYLTYADNNPRQNKLRYATSSSPLGPWTYRGVFLDTTGCDTNHGSVVEFKGKWYAFYHNQSLSNTGKGNLRSICVDVLNFNDDGTIQMVNQTKSGVAPVAKKSLPTKKAVKYEAENATMGGNAAVVNSESASGGRYVTNLDAPGSYILFDHIAGKQKGGRATIHIYHSGSKYSKIKLIVNGTDYSYLNALPTGDTLNFKGHSYLTVNLNTGKNNTIQLVGGNGSIHIDYITLSPVE
ncbi:MAG: Xylan 1,4-beta-xylosidase [Sediminibacterium sp.]|nr:Xylan 1,4-beta-xylosidase [Sediminibacterium sp.]